VGLLGGDQRHPSPETLAQQDRHARGSAIATVQHLLA
jgi:hypothetical protein